MRFCPSASAAAWPIVLRSSRDPHRQNRAFTLIELLVVISIIAVLASILLAVVPMVHRRADEASCVSNLRQVMVATNVAAGENNGRYPSMRGFVWEPYHSYDPNNPSSEWALPANPWLSDLLAPYIGGAVNADPAQVLRCPAALKNSAENWLWATQYANYRYNVFYAQDRIPLFGSSQAMLFFDASWPDWTVTDLAHQYELNVGYADGHISAVSYATYKALNPGADETGNKFFQLGWVTAQ